MRAHQHCLLNSFFIHNNGHFIVCKHKSEKGLYSCGPGGQRGRTEIRGKGREGKQEGREGSLLMLLGFSSVVNTIQFIQIKQYGPTIELAPKLKPSSLSNCLPQHPSPFRPLLPFLGSLSPKSLFATIKLRLKEQDFAMHKIKGLNFRREQVAKGQAGKCRLHSQTKILQAKSRAAKDPQMQRGRVQVSVLFEDSPQPPHPQAPLPALHPMIFMVLGCYNRLMGNDGGDIPGRKQLVRDKKKVEVPTAESIAMGRSRFCNLTKEPLAEPLAVCRLGYIYNYENLLSSLVRKELPSKYSYIRKLTDIKKLIIERPATSSDNYIACPISKLEYNGFNKFVAFWPCGHVVSRKALKEVKLQKKACIVCQQEYKPSELIDLNLEPETIELMRKALIEKRSKKEKKEGGEEQGKSEPTKLVKEDFHIGALDRLGGEFRDIIRSRENFKGIFQKQEEGEWQKNTFFASKK